MKAIEKLKNVIKTNNSLLCVGLDSDIEKIPGIMKKGSNPVLEFNKKIIDATKDIVCAYKINIAFYEIHLKECFNLVKETLDYIPDNVLTIIDAKRGDIGNTSNMYAKTYFEKLNTDSVTLNPYMGYDSINSFAAYEDKLLFILALTSNPSSRDFQIDGDIEKSLFIKVIDKVKEWDKDNMGIVAGATHDDILDLVFRRAGSLPVLIPGLGTQGGSLERSVGIATGSDSTPIFNVSRKIIFASSEDDFEEDVRKTALYFRDEINKYRRDIING